MPLLAAALCCLLLTLSMLTERPSSANEPWRMWGGYWYSRASDRSNGKQAAGSETAKTTCQHQGTDQVRQHDHTDNKTSCFLNGCTSCNCNKECRHSRNKSLCDSRCGWVLTVPP